MQSMSVRPEQVRGLSAEIRNGANGIQETLSELESKINTLRSQWSGEAQASYDESQRRWNTSLSELQQLLDQIATRTNDIADSYVNTDGQAAKRFL